MPAKKVPAKPAPKPKTAPAKPAPKPKTAPAKPAPKPNRAQKAAQKPTKTDRHFESVKAFDAFWKRRDGHVLVFVYSDGCPHCVAMKPEWNAFVEANNPDVLEKVSVPYHAFSDSTCMQYVHDSGVEVRGVPFVAFCQSDGRVHDFDEFLYTRNAAPRSAKMLREFVHVNTP